jgi:hypothetical protein
MRDAIEHVQISGWQSEKNSMLNLRPHPARCCSSSELLDFHQNLPSFSQAWVKLLVKWFEGLLAREQTWKQQVARPAEVLDLKFERFYRALDRLKLTMEARRNSFRRRGD